jgi:hypothetical protein
VTEEQGSMEKEVELSGSNPRPGVWSQLHNVTPCVYSQKLGDWRGTHFYLSKICPKPYRLGENLCRHENGLGGSGSGSGSGRGGGGQQYYHH